MSSNDTRVDLNQLNAYAAEVIERLPRRDNANVAALGAILFAGAVAIEGASDEEAQETIRVAIAAYREKYAQFQKLRSEYEQSPANTGLSSNVIEFVSPSAKGVH